MTIYEYEKNFTIRIKENIDFTTLFSEIKKIEFTEIRISNKTKKTIISIPYLFKEIITKIINESNTKNIELKLFKKTTAYIVKIDKIQLIINNLEKIKKINLKNLQKESLINLINLNSFMKPEYDLRSMSPIEIEEILNKTNSLISEYQKIRYIKKIIFQNMSIYEYEETLTIYLKENINSDQLLLEIKKINFKEIQI
jgi:hypothetical protein